MKLLAAFAMDTLQLIETKKAEAIKRVTKLRAQLDAAESDLRNLEITAETLTRLGLNPEVETTVPRRHSYSEVFNILGDTHDDGKTPKEIHEALLANGVTSISQDNVRTILSRHKDRFETHEGRYWRKAEESTSKTITPGSPPNLHSDKDLLGGTDGDKDDFDSIL